MREAFLVLLSLILSLPTFAQTFTLDDYIDSIAGQVAELIAGKGVKVAAVVEFGTADYRTGAEAGALGRYLGYSLAGSLSQAAAGRFKVADRDAIAKILAEQELQLSGLAMSALGAGKILPCDALVLGSIASDGSAVSVNARVVSVDSGELLGQVNRRVSMSPDASALLGRESRDTALLAMVAPSAASPYSISLRALAGSAPKREYDLNGESWVLAEPGQEYEIVIENRSSRDVAVALLIDGINTAFMRRQAPARGSKWIVRAGTAVVIRGWQVDASTARRFVFASASGSLAASMGFTSEIGLISASFFPARADQSRGEQEAGTAAGPEFGQAVKMVLLGIESKPAEVIVLHYDYRLGLERRGIKP